MNTYQNELVHLLDLFDSPSVKEFKDGLNLKDVSDAENNITQAMEEIENKELRFTFDMLVGQVAAAYEKLGFICGYMVNINK